MNSKVVIPHFEGDNHRVAGSGHKLVLPSSGSGSTNKIHQICTLMTVITIMDFLRSV